MLEHLGCTVNYRVIIIDSISDTILDNRAGLFNSWYISDEVMPNYTTENHQKIKPPARNLVLNHNLALKV